MKRQTKEIYGTTVHIVTLTAEDVVGGVHLFEADNAILFGDVFVEIAERSNEATLVESDEDLKLLDRDKGMKVGEGITLNEDRMIQEMHVVIGENLDYKQVHNILLSLNVERRILLHDEIEKISIVDQKQVDELEVLDFEVLTGESVKELEAIEEPTPKKAAPRKRTKKAQQ